MGTLVQTARNECVSGRALFRASVFLFVLATTAAFAWPQHMYHVTFRSKPNVQTKSAQTENKELNFAIGKHTALSARRSKCTLTYFCGLSMVSRTASLMTHSSLPSMGGTAGVPPVAIRMYFDCMHHQQWLLPSSMVLLQMRLHDPDNCNKRKG